MADTREKLIELLKKTEVNVINGHTMEAEVCFVPRVFENMADHLIANDVTIQKWIPVTERLPENSESVLCSFCGMFGQVTKIVGFANCLADVHEYDFYGHKGGGFYSYDSGYGYYEIEDVTHWMPLPEAPKGE